MGKKSDKPTKIAVSDPVNLQLEDKLVTFYRVTSIFLNAEKGPYQIAIHHRFSDFVDMHSAIKEYFARDPVLKKLPTPPPKAFTLFGVGVDHASEDFIDDRTDKLNEYMAAMRDISRVAINDSFLAFLGWYSDGKECSIATKKDPLLEFGELDKKSKALFKCYVEGFKKNPAGEPGPVEITGYVIPKDLIIRVNTDSTEGMKFKEVKKMCAVHKGEYKILFFSGAHSYAPVKVIPGEEKRRAKKKAVVSDSDDSDSHKKKSKKHKKLSSDEEDESDEDSDDEPRKKRKPAKKNKKAVSDDDSDDDSDEDSDEPRKKGKSSKKGKKASSDDSDEDKKGHKHKSHKKEESDSDDDGKKKHKHSSHKKSSKSSKPSKNEEVKEKSVPQPPQDEKTEDSELPDQGAPSEENMVV